jgi:hypothetical protein
MLGLYRKPLASHLDRSGLPSLFVCADNEIEALPPQRRRLWRWRERIVSDSSPLPARTDLCCWWDMRRFEGRPFPLPLRYNPRTGEFAGLGIFCSPACAAAYAHASPYIANKARVDGYILQLARRYGAPDAALVHAAPPREALADLCGPRGLTLAEFRAFSQCGRMRLMPPFTLTEVQVIEAQDVAAETETTDRAGVRGAAPHHRETPLSGRRARSTAAALAPLPPTAMRRNVFAGRRARRLDEVAHVDQ